LHCCVYLFRMMFYLRLFGRKRLMVSYLRNNQAVSWPGPEPVVLKSRMRCPNHDTTEPLDAWVDTSDIIADRKQGGDAPSVIDCLRMWLQGSKMYHQQGHPLPLLWTPVRRTSLHTCTAADTAQCSKAHVLHQRVRLSCRQQSHQCWMWVGSDCCWEINLLRSHRHTTFLTSYVIVRNNPNCWSQAVHRHCKYF